MGSVVNCRDLVTEIFNKAWSEKTYTQMYTNLSQYIIKKHQENNVAYEQEDSDKNITFRILLLNKC